jgi:hypothetical protein
MHRIPCVFAVQRGGVLLGLALPFFLSGCTGSSVDQTGIDGSTPLADAALVDGGTFLDATGTDAVTDGTTEADATLDGASDAMMALLPCVRMTMGPAGGSLVHPSGARIAVPAGALAAATELSLCPEAAPAVLSGLALGQGFEAGPEGLTFQKPVDVAVPFDATRILAGSSLAAVQMRMAPQGTSDFGALQSSVDLGVGLVHASTTHFTQFVPAQTAAPIFITSSPQLPNATVGVAYGASFAASGGTPPYAWSVPTAASLPSGLSLNGAGVLAGTPLVPNNFAFFVAVTDSMNNAVEMAVSVTVNPPNSPVPTLIQVAPATLGQGSVETAIVLTGTGFVPQAQVLWDGSPLPTTFGGATQLAASVPPGDLLIAGFHQVTVSNPPPGGGVSGPVSFVVTPAVLNPTPAIVSVAPTQLPISSIDVQIAITGSNFISGSSAEVASRAVTTSVTSATQLLAVVPAAYLLVAGTLPIAVFSPAPGGGSSGTVTVTVGNLNPVPTLWSVGPSSVPAGSGNLVVNLTGSGFVAGGQAFLGSSALATTVSNATTAAATLPSFLLSASETDAIIFVNPSPGGGPSAAVLFSIVPPNDAGVLADASGVAEASSGDLNVHAVCDSVWPSIEDVYVDAGYQSAAALSAESANALAFASYDANCQLTWVPQASNSWFESVGTDLAGARYCGGFNGLPLGTALISKFDTTGALQWTHSFPSANSQTTGIAVTANGNSVIEGFFEGQINLGKGVLTDMSAAGTTGTVFLAGFDANGVAVWSKVVTPFGASVEGAALGPLSIDATGRSAIVVEPNPAPSKSYIEVDDASGDVAWSTMVSGVPGGLAAFDPSGNLYFLGSSTGGSAVDLGQGPIATPATPASVLAKYDTNGIVIWSEFLPAPFAQLTVDATGAIYLSGCINGTIDLGTGPMSGTVDSSGFADNILVAKFDQSGAIVWARIFHMSPYADGGSTAGGLSVSGLGVDSTGALLLTGTFSNVLDLGAGPMVATGEGDGFFARLTQ